MSKDERSTDVSSSSSSTYCNYAEEDLIPSRPTKTTAGPKLSTSGAILRIGVDRHTPNQVNFKINMDRAIKRQSIAEWNSRLIKKEEA